MKLDLLKAVYTSTLLHLPSLFNLIHVKASITTEKQTSVLLNDGDPILKPSYPGINDSVTSSILLITLFSICLLLQQNQESVKSRSSSRFQGKLGDYSLRCGLLMNGLAIYYKCLLFQKYYEISYNSSLQAIPLCNSVFPIFNQEMSIF